MMYPKRIWFDNEQIYLELKDGQIGFLPLRRFSRLYNANKHQRENYTLSPFGIHWKEIDEDLSFEGFFYKER
ncbi:MAG: DUF2442 domain-containing protein [Candidatus Symbiothrix sp.]|nr:DUF2442 domain-containing protein [Candidatus Symbiothrix sp.]